jgi:hypothetical protein
MAIDPQRFEIRLPATDCLRIVAGARGSIENRIKLMSQLLNTRGTVAIPRELLHPRRKRKGT